MHKIINNKGFTALELLIVIAIIGILSAIAVPSFRNMIQENQLKQVLESVKSDLQLARTTAIKKSSNVVFSIKRTSTDPGAWCYGLTTKTAGCDCMEASAAATGCEIKVVSGTNFDTIRFRTSTAYNITFDFRRGTATGFDPAYPVQEFPFSSASVYRSSVYLNDVGQATICNPRAFAPDEIAISGLTC